MRILRLNKKRNISLKVGGNVDKKFTEEYFKGWDLKPYQKAYLSMIYAAYQGKVHQRFINTRKMFK